MSPHGRVVRPYARVGAKAGPFAHTGHQQVLLGQPNGIRPRRKVIHLLHARTSMKQEER